MLFQRLRNSIVGTLLARAISLFVAQYVAWIFGANQETDAVFLALAILVFGGDLVRLSVEPALVPELVRFANGHADMLPSAHSQLSRFAIRLGLIAAATLAAAGLAVAVITGRSLLTSTPGRVLQLAPAAVALPIIAVDTALLNSRHDFFKPGAIAALGSATTLLVLLAFGRMVGTTALTVGYVAGWSTTATVMHLTARRRLGRSSTPAYTQPINIRSTLRRMAPVVAGSSLINVNPIADRMIAAWVGGVGAVTIFELSSRAYGIALSLATTSLGSVFLVHWSQAHAAGDVAGARKKLFYAFKFIAPILLVGTCAFYAAIPIGFRILFQHGAFTEQDVALAIVVARWLALAVPAVVTASLLARFIYSMGDTSFAFASAVVAVAVNIPADIALGRAFGLPGIAIATIVNYSCITAVAAFWIRRGLRQARASTS